MPDDRLESWKEIAAYVKRGVRTVRRWEAGEGLPVHRHVHRTHGSVYAFKSEIDAWRASAERAAASAPRAPADGSTVEAQERLAQTIVDALRRTLGDGERRRLAERPVADAQADECYLRARQEGWRWRADAIDHAIRVLRNGLDLVGDNARLHAALGLAWLQYREAGIDVTDGPVVEAERAAARVFAIDPSSAEGLQLRGWIHYTRGDIQAAVIDLKAALAQTPGHADTLLRLANCYLISGRVAAARPLIDELVAIDPLTPLTRCMPAFADVLEGRWEATIEPYARMFAMDPANPMARLFYVWVLAVNRRDAEACELAGAIPAEVRETVPGRLCAVLACAIADDVEGIAGNVTPDVEAAAHATDVFPRMLAEAFARAGVRDRALHWLALAVERGVINYPFLARHDPFFRGMSDDPDYLQLLAAVRLRWERFAA